MLMPYEVSEEELDDVFILRISGDVDASASPYLKERLISLQSTNIYNFIIDFKGVTHINSLAMGILRARLLESRKHKGDIKLINLNTHIFTIFANIGLDELFQIYTSEKAALDNF